MYIYGAGNQCQKCINIIDEKIVAIIDRNPDLWGHSINNISIIPFEKADMNEPIIISVNNYIDIVQYLLCKGVKKEKIFVFRINEEKIISLDEMYNEFIKEVEYRKNAVKTIKAGLIQEVFDMNEFRNITKISVCGSEEDYVYIHEFVKADYEDIFVVFNEYCYEKNTLHLLTNSDYKDRIEQMKKICNDSNWVVLPLYDVEQSLDWK